MVQDCKFCVVLSTVTWWTPLSGEISKHRNCDETACNCDRISGLMYEEPYTCFPMVPETLNPLQVWDMLWLKWAGRRLSGPPK